MFVPKKYGSIFENNIKISGSSDKIKEINTTSNVVYVSVYKNNLDFLYINLAIDRFGFYIPRFFIDKKLVDSRLKRYLFKIMGGYIIDSGKLMNPIYVEVAQNYLSTMVEHGVPVLFFPEIKVSNDGNVGEINRDFLSRMLDPLYKNSEEIALVPIEISYYKRPKSSRTGNSDNSISIKKILENRININFSDPILVSDFSNSSNIVPLLLKNIEDKWKSDSSVFPHYIFSRILKDNGYELNMDDANRFVLMFMQKFNGKVSYRPKQIIKNGVDFLLQNKLCSLESGRLTAIKKEEVDYYSNLIYNQLSE